MILYLKCVNGQNRRQRLLRIPCNMRLTTDWRSVKYEKQEIATEERIDIHLNKLHLLRGLLRRLLVYIFLLLLLPSSDCPLDGAEEALRAGNDANPDSFTGSALQIFTLSPEAEATIDASRRVHCRHCVVDGFF